MFGLINNYEQKYAAHKKQTNKLKSDTISRESIPREKGAGIERKNKQKKKKKNGWIIKLMKHIL